MNVEGEASPGGQEPQPDVLENAPNDYGSKDLLFLNLPDEVEPANEMGGGSPEAPMAVGGDMDAQEEEMYQ